MAAPAEDADLVVAVVGGDQAAFAHIYDRYVDRIHDFCWSQLRNTSDAADATQDTMVKAMQKLAQLREPSSLRPWLYSIARREVLNRVEARRRLDMNAEFDSPVEDDADRAAVDSETVELVWDAAEGLEPRDRLTLDLAVRQGLDGTELAMALDVQTGHAYTLLSNAKKRLGRCVGALLVARSARRHCRDLDRVLGEWDGRLTPKLRTSVNRHVDGCDRCDEQRVAMTDPSRLLAVTPIAVAPAFLRELVLTKAVASAGPVAATTVAPAGHLVAKALAAVVGVIAVGGGVVVAIGQSSDSSPAAGPAPSPTPSVQVSIASDQPVETTIDVAPSAAEPVATTVPTSLAMVDDGEPAYCLDVADALARTAGPDFRQSAEQNEAHVRAVRLAAAELIGLDGLPSEAVDALSADLAAIDAAIGHLEAVGFDGPNMERYWPTSPPAILDALDGTCADLPNPIPPS